MFASEIIEVCFGKFAWKI